MDAVEMSEIDEKSVSFFGGVSVDNGTSNQQYFCSYFCADMINSLFGTNSRCH
jgi:hypothetical protein